MLPHCRYISERVCVYHYFVIFFTKLFYFRFMRFIISCLFVCFIWLLLLKCLFCYKFDVPYNSLSTNIFLYPLFFSLLLIILSTVRVFSSSFSDNDDVLRSWYLFFPLWNINFTRKTHKFSSFHAHTTQVKWYFSCANDFVHDISFNFEV